ncbi:hypothetical protein I6B53_00825 [Schaalia sp. 19OD2882]|uniref:hypothetical protein n=1 Tax=Schaalia sp. 19OD2882 TaxID=2794089 RepID=UPI001C1EBBC3|nr:hypothetical protein [Schaalia sp. 19OD2882]QWW19719.1 hypothetical protein I6B53_00825 [Schaalia sp. 19OD2882]
MPVRWCGLAPDEVDAVERLAGLVGVGLAPGPPWAGCVLALAGVEADLGSRQDGEGGQDSGAYLPEGTALLRIGPGGHLRLPEEERALLDVLVAASGKAPGSEGRGQHPVVLVATWSWTCDGARLARDLARSAGAVLVDATGIGPRHLPVDVGRGVRWAQLREAERSFPPEIVDQFPQVDGVKVLGADARGGVLADDPLLAALVESVSAVVPVVVDAGRWDERAARCRSAQVVVLTGAAGRADTAQACAALLAWGVPDALAVVTQGRRWPAFEQHVAALVADHATGRGIAAQDLHWERILAPDAGAEGHPVAPPPVWRQARSPSGRRRLAARVWQWAEEHA